MKFKPALLLACGLSVITAWTIPENHPDGVYEVSFGESGTSTHTLVAPIIPTFESATPRRRNIKRTLQGSNAVGCGGDKFGASAANAAVAALKNQCVGGPTGGGAVGGNRDFYSISGAVVVYFCNFSSKENHCYADEVDDAITQGITGACGSYSYI